MRFLPARRVETLPATRSRAHLQRGRGLTASAVPAKGANATALRRLSQPWQGRALARYEDVGECWYPAQFYARTMQRVRFFPGFRDDKGYIQEVEVGPLADLFGRIQDPGGGLTELIGSYGHLMFLTGDGYLVVSDTDGEETWEYLSPLELAILPESAPGRTSYRRLRAPGLTPAELIDAPDDSFDPMGNEARVYRLYRRHPAFSDWADSPVRAVLDLYELLKILTLAAGAEGQSRAANRGLLYVPNELTFTNPDAATGGEEDMQEDTFMQDFIEGLMRAISSPGDASAMSPFIIRGPGLAQTGLGTATPMADLIKWMPVGPADSYRAVDAWEKVIDRIAKGLDLPGSILTGEAKNHWGDWLVDEQGFRQHVAPICDKWGADMVAAYLRPAAKAEGIENWQNVAIGYDPSAAVNHPDETKIAEDLHDRLVISDEALREAGGYTDDDAPDEEELERRTLVKINVDPFAAATAEGETAPADAGTGADTVEAPPIAPVEAAPAETAPANGQVVAAARIFGASEAHILRARSLAGARLRTRSQGCASCQETVQGIQQSLVASALGADSVREIINGHSTEADLVAGAGDELAETLVRLGVRGDWPVQIGRLVEQHGLRTLYEANPPPLPAGFAAVVAKAVAA